VTNVLKGIQSHSFWSLMSYIMHSLSPYFGWCLSCLLRALFESQTFRERGTPFSWEHIVSKRQAKCVYSSVRREKSRFSEVGKELALIWREVKTRTTRKVSRNDLAVVKGNQGESKGLTTREQEEVWKNQVRELLYVLQYVHQKFKNQRQTRKTREIKRTSECINADTEK
jgi:hypothetical protein